MTRLKGAALAVCTAVLLVLVPSAVGKDGPPVIKDGSVVEVQILGLNDFHGNLQPPTGSSGRVPVSGGTVDAGGAAYLATQVKTLEQANANSIVVSAGDLIGASPLLSALFHDEPTIEAMNLIGLDINAVGNHEFDEGTTELLRMQNGGCHPVDGCLDGDGFAGAKFQFLAANVVNEATGKTLFAPYTIKNFNGAKVAFVGMTLEGTPDIVSPSGIVGWDFRDEADTVNALIPELEAQDVGAVVVLIHEGGNIPANQDINACGVSGPIVDIVNRFDDRVDLVISGHTHQPYNCVIDGKPVTSAFSFGRVVTDIDVRVDRAKKEVTSIKINNTIVTRTATPDAAINALIDRYNVIAAPIANRPIGSITATIVRAQNAAGESPLGNVIADGQLEATTASGNAVIALMNPGGVRADLTFPSSPAGEGDGIVTYGEMFTVQPFGNNLVTVTLTGAQIDSVLEQQFTGCLGATTNRILQPSVSLTYTWSISAAPCSKVSNVQINGAPIDPAATYRVTVNSFLADGGDGFSTLTAGTDRLGGAVDTDAFEAYFAAHSPVSPPALNRITQVP
jgi:5'-nucleotidase